MDSLHRLVALLSPSDLAALLLFVAGWCAYEWSMTRATRAGKGLRGVTHAFRVQWGREMSNRENRIVDCALTGNLMNSASFYANATIYIIAGMIAVAGALDPLMQFTEELPFARAQTRQLLEAKIFLMIGIFIFAYFKFTWALRQFNILSILIGSAPPRTAPAPELEMVAERFGNLNTLAGDEFNDGIRAYYFGFAALAWFVSPNAFMLGTALVLVVLWRRDFHSNTFAALKSAAAARFKSDA